MTNKEALNVLKKRVKKSFGKRCKTFLFSCWKCDVYMALDILEEWLGSEDGLEEEVIKEFIK